MIRSLLLLIFFVVSQSLNAQGFRVSIATYTSDIQPKSIKDAGISGVFRKVDQNKLFHYYIGDFETEAEADEARLELQLKGFVDSKVIDLEEQKMWCGSPCPYFMNDYVYNHIGSDGLMVGSIFFLKGGSKISREGTKTAFEFAKILKNNPSYRLHLGGHADASGSSLGNIYIATERLEKVKKILMRYGVKSQAIQGLVFGSGMPLGGDKKYDRRVVLSVLDSSGQVVSRNRATIRVKQIIARKR